MYCKLYKTKGQLYFQRPSAAVAVNLGKHSLLLQFHYVYKINGQPASLYKEKEK